MKQTKILIATTNKGKFQEFITELADLPFQFINLYNIHLDNLECNEPYATTWENALYKAKFFAEKSKYLTIAEDSGIFVNYLDGYPGVATKRSAATPEKRVKIIIKKLAGIPTSQRGAFFETSGCLYDPLLQQSNIVTRRAYGRITQRIKPGARSGMEHDAIFYFPPKKKLFIDMSVTEKNLVSHRRQAIQAIKKIIQRQYGLQQFIVPLAFVIKNRRILLLQRRDPRPDFNNKWEFPGGGVENAEGIEECLKRETKEETGLSIKIIERLPKIYTAVQPKNKGNYQVFLINFVCAVISGEFQTRDAETAAHGWFTLQQVKRLSLLPLNKKIIQDYQIILKKYID